jgi:HSP20 family molecular chaperone IbpA
MTESTLAGGHERDRSQHSRGQEETRGAHFFRPNVDIFEQTEKLVVLADMPGVKPSDLEVHFEDGLLTIRGHVEPRQPEQVRSLQAEFGVGDFFRTFRVSEQIDASQISADYHDGVLTLHLPKAAALKPRKITVQAK